VNFEVTKEGAGCFGRQFSSESEKGDKANVEMYLETEIVGTSH
jgi:hypothetical protein